jgi:hypothetical protein
MSSSESNSNSKFRTAPSVNDFSDSNENNYSCWDTTKAIKELKNFEINIENKTLTEVLIEVYQAENNCFDRYDIRRGYIPALAFHLSDKYSEIQNIKNYLNELALWLYNGKIIDIPTSLREQMIYRNDPISSFDDKRTTIEPNDKNIVDWIICFFELSDEKLIESFNTIPIFKKNITKCYGNIDNSKKTECLKKEIYTRAFNSDVLFERDSSGKIIRFITNNTVSLVDGVLLIDN